MTLFAVAISIDQLTNSKQSTQHNAAIEEKFRDARIVSSTPCKQTSNATFKIESDSCQTPCVFPKHFVLSDNTASFLEAIPILASLVERSGECDAAASLHLPR
jgi:hypothetical protein